MKTKLQLNSNNGFKKLLFATIAFFIFGLNAFSQVCNLGYTGNYPTPSGCQTYSRSLGAGEYGNVQLTSGVSYNFVLNSTATQYNSNGIGVNTYYSNGVCINGGSNGTSFNYTASYSGGYNVGTNRIIVDDEVDGILVNPEEINVYGDIFWSTNTKVPV